MSNLFWLTDAQMARLQPFFPKSHGKCLIPRFDGAILSQEWKEALWARFAMEAPRPRTPSELQYNDRKLRSRR